MDSLKRGGGRKARRRRPAALANVRKAAIRLEGERETTAKSRKRRRPPTNSAPETDARYDGEAGKTSSEEEDGDPRARCHQRRRERARKRSDERHRHKNPKTGKTASAGENDRQPSTGGSAAVPASSRASGGRRTSRTSLHGWGGWQRETHRDLYAPQPWTPSVSAVKKMGKMNPYCTSDVNTVLKGSVLSN